MMDTHTAESAEREAERVAAEACTRAGVRIAEVSKPAEASELAGLFMTVWETTFEHAPLSSDLLCALAFTGQYVVTARREGELVGGTVGFRTDEGGTPRLHSHITGVLPGAQGGHVGFALKLHQRAWALQRGLDGINWTFDPLVRRNAYFNLTKLGATAERYSVNAYGDMADAINAGGESDRYVAEWPVSASRNLPVDTGAADLVLSAAADGSPVLAEPAGAAARRRAWIPEDILDLRARDPD